MCSESDRCRSLRSRKGSEHVPPIGSPSLNGNPLLSNLEKKIDLMLLNQEELQKKVDSIECNLKKELSNLVTRCKGLEAENMKLKSELTNNNYRLNRLEQDQLENFVEIAGIPVFPDENKQQLVVYLP